jgi:hypothetical protein
MIRTTVEDSKPSDDDYLSNSRNLDHGMLDDFINNMNAFCIHVTGFYSSQNNEFGFHVLNLFISGPFNKRLYNGTTPAILGNFYSNRERIYNMTSYYIRKSSILQKQSSN